MFLTVTNTFFTKNFIDQIWPYFYEYLKVNYFAVVLALSLLVLSLIKYLKLSLTGRKRFLLLLIIVFGLFLRIFWLQFSSHRADMSWQGTNIQEFDWINIHAIELTKGIWFCDEHGVPQARRPIGYPIFLGILYKLFGIHISVVWIAQLCLYLVSAYLIFLIAKELFSERVALIAVFFFSIYPVSIYQAKLVTDEHLFLPLWYGGLYLLIRGIKNGFSRLNWLWYGLIFGYATITRTHTIFMPLVVGLAQFLKKMKWRQIILQIFLVGFVMQAINLPWVIRNYRVWGVPVLYTATAGFIYSQLNSTASPEGGGHLPQVGEEGYSETLEHVNATGNPGLIHQQYGSEAMRWMVHHPQKFLSLGIARLLFFMNWNRKGGVWPIWYQYYEGSYDPLKPLSANLRIFIEEAAFLAYYITLYCFIFSLILIGVRWKEFPAETKNLLMVIGSCFFFYFAEHMIIYPERKYRYPLEPLMMIGASYFLEYVLVKFRWESLWNKGWFRGKDEVHAR